MIVMRRAEERGHAPSETEVGAVLTSLFHRLEGRRVITASFASHIHRIQQIADGALAHARDAVKSEMTRAGGEKGGEEAHGSAAIDDEQVGFRAGELAATSHNGERVAGIGRFDGYP